jgi:uncharacterized protein (TIGR02246 family)
LSTLYAGGEIHATRITNAKEIMRYTTFLVILLGLSLCSVAQLSDSSSTGKSASEAAIHQVLVDFVSAWNVHDAAAFSMVFTEDADFTNIRGMGAHGRTNIDSFHAPVFRTWFKNSHQDIIRSTIRFISPDVAAVDAWWEMTGSTSPAGQSIPLRKGLLNFVMTRKNEKWLISVMHNMELAAIP